MNRHLRRTLNFALFAHAGFLPLVNSNAQSTAGSIVADSSKLASRAADSLRVTRRTTPLPVVGSSPETGLQYGATVLSVQQHPASEHSRPATTNAYVIVTAKQQMRIGAETDWWSRENRWRLAGTAQWQRFKMPYYGIGDQTPESNKETLGSEGIELTTTVQRHVMRSYYAIAALRFSDQEVTRADSSALQSTTATSVIPGIDGGRVTQFTVGVLSDTRDFLYAPTHGRLVQLTVSQAARALLSDYNFTRLKFDARKYVSLSSNRVIAAQAQLLGTTGNAPFDQLSLVGGSDIMRGYVRGRYRDRWMAATQIEFRAPINSRMHAVMFGGAGVIAPTIGTLSDGEVLPTYGAGLRFGINKRERTNIRLDYGRGRQGASGLYIGFNDAF